MGSPWRKLNRASQRMKHGRLEEAEALLVEAAQALPSQAPPGIQLGLCRLAAGNAAEAEAALRAACEADRSNPAAFLFRALAVSDQGRHEEAWVHLEEARRLCPGNQVLSTAEAVLALRQGRFQVALDKLGVTENRPVGGELANSGSILGRLVVELERRLLPLEIPRLERSSARDAPPEAADEPAPGCLGQLSQLPRSLRAMEVQKKGLKVMDRAHAHRGAEQRYELVEQALERFREARRLDPCIFRASFYVGEALLYGAKLERGEGFPRERLLEARECFYDAWRREGPNPYLFYYLGKSSSLLGEAEAGAEYFRQALSRFEKLPEAHYGLGQGLLLLGREAEARRALLAAVQSDGLMARDRLRDFHESHARSPELLARPLPSLPPEREEEPPESAGLATGG